MADKTELLQQPDVRAAWLLVTTGPHRGRDYRLRKTSNIGRDAQANEIIIDDDAVSAEHARIHFENGVYVLYDLASSNGTRLNNERIQKAILRDEDRIEVGHTVVVFKEAKV